MSLRWIERDGKMVLQQLTDEVKDPHNFGTVWQDVPTHQEPKKVTVEEELAKAIGIKIGSDHCELEAKAAIEFFKKRMDAGLMGGKGMFSYSDVKSALFGEA